MTDPRNLVAKTGLAVVAAFFLYGWAIVGGSGSVVGSPVQVLGYVGTALLYATIFLTFATIYVAASRAHRAGSWIWFFGVIFLWPLSYFYALAVNRNG